MRPRIDAIAGSRRGRVAALVCALLGACDGAPAPDLAPKAAAPQPAPTPPAAPATPPASPPVAATPPATTPTPPPPAPPALPVAETGRPKTMEAALARVQKIAESGDAKGLLALTDSALGLEHKNLSNKRAKKIKLANDDPNKFVASLSGAKFEPIHYLGALISEMGKDRTAGELKLGERKGVIEALSQGAYGVNFVFTQKDDGFVLTQIETWEEGED